MTVRTLESMPLADSRPHIPAKDDGIVWSLWTVAGDPSGSGDTRRAALVDVPCVVRGGWTMGTDDA
jgi:hypothetical protein